MNGVVVLPETDPALGVTLCALVILLPGLHRVMPSNPLDSAQVAGSIFQPDQAENEDSGAPWPLQNTPPPMRS